MRSTVSPHWLVAAAVLAALSFACQKLQEPVPTLTQDQWRRVRENLLETPPETANPMDAVFGDRVRLVGWDVEPTSIELGEAFTMTFYWEVLQPLDERWRIFVHLDGDGRQNLDHEAVGDIFPSVYWEPGQIIRDEVTGELSSDLGDGDIRVYTGLYFEDQRMPVTRAGEGTLEEDGRLNVGTIAASWEPPAYTVRRVAGDIAIDGRLNERAWNRARRTPDWVQPSSGDDAEPQTWGKLLWDDEALYVALFARDEDVWATFEDRDANLWDEEVLEVYIDASGDGRNYLELQINPLGTVFDAVFEGPTNRNLPRARAVDIAGLQSAVHVDGTINDGADTDRSWSAEIRIPFTSLPGVNAPPANADEWRVNFYRYDRSQGDDETRYFAWSPVGGGTFHRPDRFGVATFQGAPRTPRRGAVDEGSGEAPAEGSGETPAAATDAPAEGSGVAVPNSAGRPLIAPNADMPRLRLAPQNAPGGGGR